jgi:hypothetical protein
MESQLAPELADVPLSNTVISESRVDRMLQAELQLPNPANSLGWIEWDGLGAHLVGVSGELFQSLDGDSPVGLRELSTDVRIILNEHRHGSHGGTDSQSLGHFD